MIRKWEAPSTVAGPKAFIKTMGRTAGALWGATLLAVVLFGIHGGALEGQVPPDEAWRTINTEHFRVTFPERLEALGRRAAGRAELAYDALSESFVDPPGGRVDVLLTIILLFVSMIFLHIFWPLFPE